MIDILKKILDGAYIVNSNTQDDGGMKVTLQDRKMKVTLDNIPSSSLILKVNENEPYSLMVNDCLKKSCDFLIFNPSNNKKHLDVYLIEMKETQKNDNKQEAKRQIICTIPTIDYLLSMVREVERYNSNNKKSIKKVKKHCIIIFEQLHNRIDKQPLRKTSMTYESDYGQRFNIFINTSIPFSKLKKQTSKSVTKP